MLACQKQWEARTEAEDWQFCPYCGVRWTGMAGGTRDERYHGRRQEVRMAMCRRPTKPPVFSWIIETRATWEGESPGEWDFDRSLEGFRTPMMEVYRTLQLIRAECRHHTAGSKGKIVWEYRIRTVRGPA